MESKLIKMGVMMNKKTVFVVLFLLSLFGGLKAQNNIILDEGCTTQRMPFDFSVVEAWRTPASPIYVDNRNTPVVGDIDGDGMAEVLCAAGSPGSMIYVFEGQTGVRIGTANMKYPTNQYLSPLLIFRPSADAKALLFVANVNPNTMGLYEVTSAPGARPITFAPKWEKEDVAFITPNIASTHILCMPIVADFDGDGVAELFSSGCFIDVETGNILATVPVTGVGGWYLSYPLAADVDRDGKPELIVGTKVYKFDRSATTRITDSATCPGLSEQEGFNMVADVNQDGLMDVVYHNAHDHKNNAYIKVWTPETGDVVGDFTIAKTSWRSYPFVGDIDGLEDAANGNKKYPEISDKLINSYFVVQN
jgi:hypothetical protein